MKVVGVACIELSLFKFYCTLQQWRLLVNDDIIRPVNSHSFPVSLTVSGQTSQSHSFNSPISQFFLVTTPYPDFRT